MFQLNACNDSDPRFKIVPWNPLFLFQLQLISLLSHHPPPTVTQSTIRVWPSSFFYQDITEKFRVFLCFVSSFICRFSDSDLGFVFAFAECIVHWWWSDGQCWWVLSLTWNYYESLNLFVVCFGFFYVLCMHACLLLFIAFWMKLCYINYTFETDRGLELYTVMMWKMICREGIRQNLRFLIGLKFFFLFVDIKSNVGCFKWGRFEI